MDDLKTQRINEAAQSFVEALAASYEKFSDGLVSTRQLNAELALKFFNAVIENLRRTLGHAREATKTRFESRPTAAATRGHAGANAGVRGDSYRVYRFHIFLLFGRQAGKRQRV
jgi:hypothetical protein